jgi:protein-S-isoprenylcysteine O-methyltransferase Ste14
VPWSWLTKILLLWVASRGAGSRQAGRPAVDVEAVRTRVASAREPAMIAGRIAVVAVLACICAGLLAAGTPALVLGPSWLGWAAFGVALVVAAVGVPQVTGLRRALRTRRLRLRDREVGRELDRTRPA